MSQTWHLHNFSFVLWKYENLQRIYCHLSGKFMTFLRKCNKLSPVFATSYAIWCNCTQRNLLLWQNCGVVIDLIRARRKQRSLNNFAARKTRSFPTQTLASMFSFRNWYANTISGWTIWILNFFRSVKECFNPFSDEARVWVHISDPTRIVSCNHKFRKLFIISSQSRKTNLTSHWKIE